MMHKALKMSFLAILAVSFILQGCSASKTVKGGAIGAGAGGLIGAIIGKQTGNTATGAAVGAAVGGTAGALIGRHMDKEAEELAKVEGAKVERVGEGIQLTMESGILFATNQSTLQPDARQNIQKMADVFTKYPDTNLVIAGHTDSDGTDEYNQKLSERRAQAVADYLRSLGVAGARLQTIGLGETTPVDSNETSAGKQANRRVEVTVSANEQMRQQAEQGTLK